MSDPPPPPFTTPVVEERVAVRRAVRTRGRVRVRKRVVTEPGSVEVMLRTASVHTERVLIGRVVPAVPEVRTEGEVTIVPVVEERLVLRKELVLVEELRITRQFQEQLHHEEVPLRRELVEIERLEPPDGPSTPPDKR